MSFIYFIFSQKDKWNLLQLICESLQMGLDKVYQTINIFRYNNANANTENSAATTAFNIFDSVDADRTACRRLKDK